MNRKKLILTATSLFFVLVFAGSIVKNPTITYAAKAGDPCCDDDQVAVGNACASQGYIASTNTFCNFLTLGFPEHIKEPTSKECKNVFIYGIKKYGSKEEFAQSFCRQITASVIALRPQEFIWKQDECQNKVLYLLNNPPLENFFNSTFDSLSTNCEDGLICRNNGAQGICTTGKFDLCAQIPDATLKDRCFECQDVGGIWTAVGCIPTNAKSITHAVIKIGLMVGGGVSLLIILAGSFSLAISRGDPKKTGESKEMITAALIGLIFIIFSVSILQFIGVQILHIPSFGI